MKLSWYKVHNKTISRNSQCRHFTSLKIVHLLNIELKNTHLAPLTKAANFKLAASWVNR